MAMNVLVQPKTTAGTAISSWSKAAHRRRPLLSPLPEVKRKTSARTEHFRL
jgi:hypothetical protein